jgi:catechol 2,3-dioxygenase-like lactoylglutathione lyase family enzyme
MSLEAIPTIASARERRIETYMPKSFDSQITFFRTTDFSKSAEFYENILNLPMVLDQGGCRIYEVTGNAYIGFCEREDAPVPEGVVFTFVTEDVDGWCDRLREAGVEFEKEPAYNPEYKIYNCFLRDPNGYLLEIQRFEDPRWES